MSWCASLRAGASVIAAGTEGLLLVDCSAGAVTATLPPTLGAAGPLFLVRAPGEASANTATFTPAPGDSLTPPSAAAPALVMRAGDALALMPVAQGVWFVAQSAYEVIVRESARAVLAGLPTIAGAAVESERVDGIAAGDTPRIVIYGDVDAQGVTGGALGFDVTLTLVIQCLVERARRVDAVQTLDTLLTQAKDALLGDPIWPTLIGTVRSIRSSRGFKAQAERILADGRLQIEVAWTETFAPRVTQSLSTVTLTSAVPAGTIPVGATIAL